MNNLLWCPIDLPKFPMYDIADLITPHLVVDEEWPEYWKTVAIPNPLLNAFRKQFPSLDKWFNLLPCISVERVKLNVQTSPVGLHVDVDPKKWENRNIEKPSFYNLQYSNRYLYEGFLNNIIYNEPSGYRVILKGNKTNKQYTVINNKKIYTTIPEDTDSFVFSSTEFLHGVDDDPGRQLLYLNFEIDKVKHQKLLQHSLEKYKEYAIFK